MILYYNLKKEINHTSNLLRKYPRDPYIRGRFFTLSKNIRRTIKKAEIDQRNLLLNKINECEKRDPNTFWRLVNEIKGKKENNECIDPDVLYQYFKDLHSVKENKYFDCEFESIINKKNENSFSQYLVRYT